MSLLTKIDLNLLPTLKVLLETRSVTRSAGLLNTSQPTVSRHLAKLRNAIKDPLLVRSAEGFILTEKAKQIEAKLNCLFPEIQGIFSGPSAEEDFPKHFCIALPDYAMRYVFSDIACKHMTLNPSLSFDLELWDMHARERLIQGHYHFAISVLDHDLPPNMIRRKIGTDVFLVVGRANHPALRTKTSAENLLQHEFVDVMTGSQWQNEAGKAFNSRRTERKVRIRVFSFDEAFAIAAKTDLLAIVPRHVAASSAAAKGLSWQNLPGDNIKLQYCMWWHLVHQDDPAHKWFRTHIFPDILTHPALVNLTMPEE